MAKDYEPSLMAVVSKEEFETVVKENSLIKRSEVFNEGMNQITAEYCTDKAPGIVARSCKMHSEKHSGIQFYMVRRWLRHNTRLTK